jgi:predicted GNAT family acetyltransferase
MTSVRDNTALSRFELDVDGATAFANYRRAGATLVITHTEVPRALRGRGIGSQLVKGVMEHARMQGVKVKPLCDFAAAVIAQHPEFRDLLA